MKHILLVVMLMSSASVFAHDGPFYSVEHLDAILLLGFAAAGLLIGDTFSNSYTDPAPG